MEHPLILLLSPPEIELPKVIFMFFDSGMPSNNVMFELQFIEPLLLDPVVKKVFEFHYGLEISLLGLFDRDTFSLQYLFIHD